MKDSCRAVYTAATDREALEGVKLLSMYEGILPALETAHAVYAAVELSKKLVEKRKRKVDVVICVSGRGDKDVISIANGLKKLGESQWTETMDFSMSN